MINFLKSTILLLALSTNIYGQSDQFKVFEDSVQSLFNKIILSKNDQEKLAHNNSIENILSKLLSNKKSFDYSFNNLKNVSKLSSSDELIRIYSWNIPFNDGTYKYFGFIQFKSNNKLLLFKLHDQSTEIKNAQNKILNHDKWYGALYYQILTNTDKNKTYYTLFGWDGNDNFTNKKIIEVLTIKNKKPQFGAAILKMSDKTHKRIIFEYAKQAKMMLRFDDKEEMIVFDHLAPSLKKFEGQYMYYGPDLSQDGLKFTDGYWVLKPNLDMRNKDDNTKKKPIKTSW